MVNLTVTKSANTAYIFLNQSNLVVYSIIITNNGDTRATNVRIKDSLDKFGEIIKNTIRVNGSNKNIIFPDNSISGGTIEPGGNLVVNYEVKVNNSCKNNNIINNQAIVIYNDESSTSECNNLTALSNIVTIPIIYINLCIKKTVDKSCVKVGGYINYSLIIRNNSNINVDNVLLNDYINSCLIIQPSSVFINGIQKNLENLENINLGTIKPNSTTIITFKVLVKKGVDCSLIKNNFNILFEYTINENGILITSNGNVISNDVYTKVLI